MWYLVLVLALSALAALFKMVKRKQTPKRAKPAPVKSYYDPALDEEPDDEEEPDEEEEEAGEEYEEEEKEEEEETAPELTEKEQARIQCALLDIEHYNYVASWHIQAKRDHMAELARLTADLEICDAMRDGKRRAAVEKKQAAIRKQILRDSEAIHKARKKVVAAYGIVGGRDLA